MVDQIAHGLGIGRGSLYEFSDGTVAYRPTGSLLPAFRVNIADVSGFSTRHATPRDRRQLKANNLQQVLTVHGLGGVLAEAAMNYGTAELIQSWFWQKQTAIHSQPLPSPDSAELSYSTADEITKLKALLDDGVITPRDFKKRKKMLLKRR
ncbi:hypothetical protein [Brevibacterium limosum]|jgi:hypothetical protein|uniref:hypothetical protein n=1 Tax=Brevibacterium limosum TaxID=2697565 RepID=UPI00141FA769|nr:hypothetical protein [Brevibacterium limosum]